MTQIVSTKAFRRLVDALQAPPIPARPEPHWPYPLPEAEMIARYGLRYLTPEEQRVFPGLPLALNVFKARLIKPPAAVPMARAGWAFGELSRAVVWIAETYPGCYLVRLPGGASLPAPYSEMSWTAPSTGSGQAVAHDVPATTFAAALATERQRQWQTAVLRGIRQNLQL